LRKETNLDDLAELVLDRPGDADRDTVRLVDACHLNLGEELGLFDECDQVLGAFDGLVDADTEKGMQSDMVSGRVKSGTPAQAGLDSKVVVDLVLKKRDVGLAGVIRDGEPLNDEQTCQHRSRTDSTGLLRTEMCTKSGLAA